MADEAAQDIEALNLRDKDRDDSERRDEVRGRDARFAQALFFQPAFAVFRDWHAYALPGPRKRRVRLFFFFLGDASSLSTATRGWWRDFVSFIAIGRKTARRI